MFNLEFRKFDDGHDDITNTNTTLLNEPFKIGSKHFAMAIINIFMNKSTIVCLFLHYKAVGMSENLGGSSNVVGIMFPQFK